ncbi:hypothetical protein [Thiospirillum jenense]|uniref:Uncharacterized protein n=1 Tax=Thiospirillum jenense TaxID=1653858 RepID=A0A839HGJ0_9GAMM|nr:hypothetical protein [Thiospirillum jenense]MBB1126238.1 hypothetical protein [Thiospirillum jenense]
MLLYHISTYIAIGVIHSGAQTFPALHPQLCLLVLNAFYYRTHKDQTIPLGRHQIVFADHRAHHLPLEQANEPITVELNWSNSWVRDCNFNNYDNMQLENNIRIELIYYGLLNNAICVADLDRLKRHLLSNEHWGYWVESDAVIALINHLQATAR